MKNIYIYAGYEFLDKKYTKWYFSIINKRISNPHDGYTERHHILPSSLGGAEIDSNLVKLTAKEHYVCHLLLTKMVTGNALYKMKNAVLCMSNMHNRWHTDRIVKSGRAFEAAKTGLVFSDDHKQKLSEAAKRQFEDPEQRRIASENAKNRVYSEETKAKMKESSAKRNLTPELRNKFRTAKDVWTGRNHSDDSRKKISESKMGKSSSFKGKTHSEESRKNMSNGRKGIIPRQVIVTCPHCGKTGPSTGINRYHFDKCKHKPLDHAPS